jgi:hypothetical protein
VNLAGVLGVGHRGTEEPAVREWMANRCRVVSVLLTMLDDGAAWDRAPCCGPQLDQRWLADLDRSAA